MATSGTMQGNSITITGGGLSGNFYFINWQLTGQSIPGNYSSINWQCYFHFNGDDAQLDNVVANLGGATRAYNGGRVYNFSSNFSTRNLGIASGSFNIGHDGAGNCTLGVDGGIDVYQSGRSQGSAAWGLPQIPRYASITGYSVTNLTDTSFNVNVSTDVWCDDLLYTLNNGATWTEVPGGFSSKTLSITGLASETTFNVLVQVRRADSGLWSSTGTIVATTNRQNNFIGIM